MTKIYCDKCGKELSADEDYQVPTWWTITRHGALDITVEVCDQCYKKHVKGADDENNH